MNFPKKLGIPEHEFRLIPGRTKIEYDENKEDINRQKHGYSLESAVHYFELLLLPLKPIPFMTSDSFIENNEVRHMHMGIDDCGDVVLFVTTMRNNETVLYLFEGQESPKVKHFSTTRGIKNKFTVINFQLPWANIEHK